MTKFDPQTSLLVVALEAELPRHIVDGWQVLYTGVGKVNAAVALCNALAKSKPPKMVINFGSAGSLRPDLTGIHEVTQFFQRDMDVRALGFDLGQTPFETAIALDLDRPGLSCGTGDHFVSAPPELQTDLVDMEAYALAKICQQQKIDFYCYKFISDNADEDAATDWSAQLAIGAKLFVDSILTLDR